MSPCEALRPWSGWLALTILAVGSVAGCTPGDDGPSCSDDARDSIREGAAELVRLVPQIRNPKPLNGCGDDDHAYSVRLDVSDSKAATQAVAALPGCVQDPQLQNQGGPIWTCPLGGTKVLVVFDNTEPGLAEITL